MNNILIIGKGGQLANTLQKSLPNATFVGLPELDLSEPQQLEQVDWKNFSVAINATAYTNVDEAETAEGRRLAWQLNAAAVAEMTKLSQRFGTTLVHISTDYVFDGTKSPHKEDEPICPLNVYGQSKAAGEYALGVWEKHYLLRTEWLIGDGKNFVNTMLALGKKEVDPKVVSDQTGRLTFTHTLTQAILHLLHTNSPFGTYHVSNAGPVASWAEMADRIFKLANLKSKVIPISTSEYFKDKPQAAQRPLRSEFDLSKLESTGFHPTDWQDELENYTESLP